MTYEFKVAPDDIDKAADQLAEIAAGSAKAVEYAKKYLDLESNAGLALKPLIGVLQEACDELAVNYTRLGSKTSESATELKNAANMYRSVDKARAEALDKTYPTKAGK